MNRKSTVIHMGEEYDFENMNPRRNPYVQKLKNQITVNTDKNMVNDFREQNKESEDFILDGD